MTLFFKRLDLTVSISRLGPNIGTPHCLTPWPILSVFIHLVGHPTRGVFVRGTDKEPCYDRLLSFLSRFGHFRALMDNVTNFFFGVVAGTRWIVTKFLPGVFDFSVSNSLVHGCGRFARFGSPTRRHELLTPRTLCHCFRAAGSMDSQRVPFFGRESTELNGYVIFKLQRTTTATSHTSKWPQDLTSATSSTR